MSGASKILKIKHLCIREEKTQAIGDLGFDEYDLAYFCSSWDARCLDVVETSIQSERSILVDLAFRDSFGLRDRADQELQAFLNARSKTTCLKQEDGPLKGVLQAMCAGLDATYLSSKAPLRILLDMTGFPRFLSLGLVAHAIKSNRVRKMSILYSEAHYGDEEQSDRITFTEGRWDAMPIWRLEGEFSPCKDTYVLVSSGFEGGKTLRAVLAREPERISVLMPDPGYTPEITQRTVDENSALVEHFKVPDEQILKAEAASLVGALKALSKDLEKPNEENVFYLCCGTKPHSLSLTLRACLSEGAAVIYHKPESYTVRRTQHRGCYWHYEIENLAAFA